MGTKRFISFSSPPSDRKRLADKIIEREGKVDGQKNWGKKVKLTEKTKISAKKKKSCRRFTCLIRILTI